MWKKIAAATAALALLMGCTNDNQIRIENVAAGGLVINFRAATYSVAAGNGITEIKDIPNGTFQYSVTYELPMGYSAGSLPSGGTLSFQKKSTKWLMLYSSVAQNGVYNVYLNQTSSDGGTVTGP